MMNGTLKDRRTQIEQWNLRRRCAHLSRPFHDVTEIKGVVINPYSLGVPKPWYPLWSVSPRVTERTLLPGITWPYYRLLHSEMPQCLFMIIQSLHGRAIRNVSAVLSENIWCVHARVFESVQKIRSRVWKRIYVLRNIFSLIKTHDTEEECLPCKLHSFNLPFVVCNVHNCVKQLQRAKLHEFFMQWTYIITQQCDLLTMWLIKKPLNSHFYLWFILKTVGMSTDSSWKHFGCLLE